MKFIISSKSAGESLELTVKPGIISEDFIMSWKNKLGYSEPASAKELKSFVEAGIKETTKFMQMLPK